MLLITMFTWSILQTVVCSYKKLTVDTIAIEARIKCDVTLIILHILILSFLSVTHISMCWFYKIYDFAA